MRKLLLLLLLPLWVHAQSPFYNDVVRSNTLSPARVANALDAAKAYTTTGTDTYSVTVFSAYAQYTTGDILKFTFSNANTSGTITINVNGLGAKAVKDGEGNNLGVGDLKAGGTYQFIYNGTNFRMVGAAASGEGGSFNHLTTSIKTGDYTATAADTVTLIYFRHLTTPMVLTLPNASVIPVGRTVAIIRDTLAGVTVVGAAGVDVIGTLTLATQKEVAVFHHRETNKWVRVGTQATSGGATAAGSTGNAQFKSAGGGLQAEAAYNYDSAANVLTVDNVRPSSNDAGALGTTSLKWSDLFLADGAVVNWNSGDVTATHSSNAVTIAGGDWVVPDDAYNASTWNGNNAVPTKNAIRDKIETMTGSIGVQDFYISAAAMWSRGTNGCSQLTPFDESTSLLRIQTLDFDAAADEFAQVTFVLPRKWDNGTVTAVFYWTTSASSGDVIWTIAGVANSNDDPLTTAFGTAQSVTDTFLAANDVHVTSATSAITFAGTPADADFLALQISRDGDNGSDTLNGDAKLLGVSLRITTDAQVDN